MYFNRLHSPAIIPQSALCLATVFSSYHGLLGWMQAECTTWFQGPGTFISTQAASISHHVPSSVPVTSLVAPAIANLSYCSNPCSLSPSRFPKPPSGWDQSVLRCELTPSLSGRHRALCSEILIPPGSVSLRSSSSRLSLPVTDVAANQDRSCSSSQSASPTHNKKSRDLFPGAFISKVLEYNILIKFLLILILIYIHCLMRRVE